jgi:hypothetical protein
MKFKNIENIDDFGGDKAFTLTVEDVDDKFIQMAKAEDGENYDEGCFGIWVNYNADEDEYYICQDSIDCELFYVNNDGDKIWMSYILTDEEAKEMIDACKKAVR